MIVGDSSSWMQDDASVLLVNDRVAIRSHESRLSLFLDYDVSSFDESDGRLGQQDDCLIGLGVSVLKMVQPDTAVLAEELVVLDPKGEIPLESIEECLLDVAGSALLVDDHSAICSILQGERASVLLDIADLLIIDVEELTIVEVVLIVLEVLQFSLMMFSKNCFMSSLDCS